MKQEEAAIVGKTWREIKPIAGNRVCWHCFMNALCSEVKLTGN
jgi:hypothetical protein